MNRIPHLLLLITLAGGMAGCISGVKQPDTYTNRNGSTVVIENDADMCKRSCNDTYARCMDTTSAGDNNSGIHGMTGVYGASADCRNALQSCLPGCKSQ